MVLLPREFKKSEQRKNPIHKLFLGPGFDFLSPLLGAIPNGWDKIE